MRVVGALRSDWCAGVLSWSCGTYGPIATRGHVSGPADEWHSGTVEGGADDAMDGDRRTYRLDAWVDCVEGTRR